MTKAVTGALEVFALAAHVANEKGPGATRSGLSFGHGKSSETSRILTACGPKIKQTQQRARHVVS